MFFFLFLGRIFCSTIHFDVSCLKVVWNTTKPTHESYFMLPYLESYFILNQKLFHHKTPDFPESKPDWESSPRNLFHAESKANLETEPWNLFHIESKHKIYLQNLFHIESKEKLKNFTVKPISCWIKAWKSICETYFTLNQK